jgi:hypothetical protein
MTLKEIIYSIREDFRLMSDDSDQTQELFAYMIRNARALVLQQRYSDPRNIVPPVEYQSLTVPIGDDARSTIQIPSVIKTTGNAHASLKVYGTGMADTMLRIPLNVVHLERLPFVGNNPYNADQIYCAIDEDGTLIFNSKNNLYRLINSVVARGLFEDPEAVYLASGGIEDFYTVKYPLSEANLIDVRKIVDVKVMNMLKIPKDEFNDATEERPDKVAQSDQ